MPSYMICILCFAGGMVLMTAVCCSTLWAMARKRGQTPPRYFVRTWQPMTPEQWATAFRNWPDTDPRWRAVWDLLAHHLEAELAGAESVGADPHAVMQWSGRLQTLLFLRAQILNLRKTQ